MNQPLPPHLSVDIAALAEPIGCCVQAVDACHVAAGDSVLVVGDGSMGLMNAAVYRTLFSLWRSLYPALQSTFSHLSQMAELDRSDWESGRDGGMPSRPIRPGDREVSP
jgi:hypothetical protein